MPSTYSSRIRAEKQAPGENEDTWGARLNSNTIDMFDAAFSVASVTVDDNVTLSANDGASDEARALVLFLSGAGGKKVTVPNVDKPYLVRNNCTAGITIGTASGTDAHVPPGAAWRWVVISAAGNALIVNRHPAPRATSTNTTLTADDDGRSVRSTQSSTLDFTIAPEADTPWQTGARVECYGGNNGSIRILQGSGVTLTWAGNTGTRTVAAGHRVTLERAGTNSWLLSGSGIT